MCITGTSMMFSANYDGNITASGTSGPDWSADPWSIPVISMGEWERTVEVINANKLNLAVGSYAKKCFASLIDHGPLQLTYEFSDVITEAVLPLIGARSTINNVSLEGVLTVTFQLVDPVTNNTPATLVGHGAFIRDTIPAFGSDGNDRGEATIEWQFDGWTDSDKDTNGPTWAAERTT